MKKVFFVLIVSTQLFFACTKEPGDAGTIQQYREIAWKSLKVEEKSIVITPLDSSQVYETTFKDIWSFAVVFQTLNNSLNGSITVFIHARDKVYIGKQIIRGN